MDKLDTSDKYLNLQNESIKLLLSYVQSFLWQWKYLLKYEKEWTASKESVEWVLHITITNIRELQNLLLEFIEKIILHIPVKKRELFKELSWNQLLEEMMILAFHETEDKDKKNCLREMYKSEIREIIDEISKTVKDEIELIFRNRIEESSWETNFIEEKCIIDTNNMRYIINVIGLELFVDLVKDIDLKKLDVLVNNLYQLLSIDNYRLKVFLKDIDINILIQLLSEESSNILILLRILKTDYDLAPLINHLNSKWNFPLI